MRRLEALGLDKCHLGAGGYVDHSIEVNVLQGGLDAALEIPHGGTDGGSCRDIEPVVRQTARSVRGGDDGGEEPHREPGTGEQLKVPLVRDAVEISKAGRILLVVMGICSK